MPKGGQGELRRKERLSLAFSHLFVLSGTARPLYRVVGLCTKTVTNRTPTSGVRGSHNGSPSSRLSVRQHRVNRGANVRSSGTLRQCDLACTSATRQAPLPSESGHRWTSHSSGTSHRGNKAFHAYQTRPYVSDSSRFVVIPLHDDGQPIRERPRRRQNDTRCPSGDAPLTRGAILHPVAFLHAL